jgi:O-antigen/teichoic acid export membrane protein
VYGGSSLLANVLGYVFLAVLSRSLTPSDYGAAGALLGAGIISSILSVALQLVIARQVATTGAASVSGRTTLLLSVGTSSLALLLVPAAVHYLHLSSPWPAVWVSLTLLPMTLAGALLGQLLGRERFVALAVATVTMATARLVSGLVSAAAGWGLAGALAALAVATCLVVIGIAVLAKVPGWWGRQDGFRPADLRDLAAAAGGVAAFLVLTNLDSVLARHYLPAEDSGIYVLGTLFAKAGLWGPQFIAVVVFPKLSSDQRVGLYRRAAFATVIFGLLIALASAVLADALIGTVSGDDYLPAAGYAPLFALLGTVFAIVNLGLLANVAISAGLFTKLLWVGVAAEAAIISFWMHDSIGQVLFACGLVAAALSVAGWVIVARQPVPVSPASVPAVS